MSPKKTQKATPHSLEGVARRVLGIDLDKGHQSSDWGGELSLGMVEYGVRDAEVLLPIAESLTAKVIAAGLEKVSEIESRALLAMVWMQNAGVPFDVQGWKEHLEQVQDDVVRLEEKLAELAPDRPSTGRWNWRSPKQVMQVFALVGLKLPDTTEETLSRYDHPLAKLLLEYRKASKLVSHFGPNLLKFVGEDDRIYPDWRQCGTETGRMSCSKPNVQQLAPEVRRAVRAPEGRTLVWADYAQAEIRILASASGDPTLVAAFRAGKDPYKATAANIFDLPEDDVTDEQRGVAKVLIFSFIFGATARGIARNLGTTPEEGSRLKQRYFAAHPDIEAFLRTTIKRVLEKGEARTLAGRLRRFGKVSLMNRKDAGHVVRQAMNHPMQGSCADSLKLALALLYERRHECPGAVPIIALHDEIVVECDEKDAEVVASWLEKAMIDGMDEVLALGASGDNRVPVEVEIKIGKTWAGGLPWSPQAPESGGEEEPAMFTPPDYGPVLVKVYTDYRDPSADVYAQIDACDECAEEFSRDLEKVDDLDPEEAAWCEVCAAENAGARRLAEQYAVGVLSGSS